MLPLLGYIQIKKKTCKQLNAMVSYLGYPLPRNSRLDDLANPTTQGAVLAPLFVPQVYSSPHHHMPTIGHQGLRAEYGDANLFSVQYCIVPPGRAVEK
jgi:hypothetical protein